MTQTLRLLLPLTTAALLASCSTTVTPAAPRLTAQDGKYRVDICPSCGRPGLGAWVAPVSAVTAPGEVLAREDLLDAEPTPLAAFVSHPSADLIHLIVAGPSDQALPVACFQPMEAARPPELPDLTLIDGTGAMNVWTGGAVRLTAPVAAQALGRAAQGDDLCRTFGPDWRMLRLNDSLDSLTPGTSAADLWAFMKS